MGAGRGGFYGAPHFSAGTASFRGGGPRFSGRTGLSATRQRSFAGSQRGTINRSTASSIARNRGVTPSGAQPSRALSQRALNGRTDHIAERHGGNWNSGWDRRRAHFHNGRFFVYDNGYWFGLDDGFYPWDYLPYYADDYYPYDYYTDDNVASGYDNTPTPDSTVQAAQTQLTQLGYYSGPVDGIFGPATRDAVAKYQTAKQLKVTGSLSRDTLQSLGLPSATAS